MVKGVKFLSRLLNASYSDVITVPLFFSPPQPPTRAIIPDARPLGTFENQDVAMTVPVRRGISKQSHEKIGDYEQSSCFTTIVPKLANSQNKVALTIMGRGSNALRMRAKKGEQEKTARGAGVGRRGRGREIFPLYFFSSVFFSSSLLPLYSTYLYI